MEANVERRVRRLNGGGRLARDQAVGHLARLSPASSRWRNGYGRSLGDVLGLRCRKSRVAEGVVGAAPTALRLEGRKALNAAERQPRTGQPAGLKLAANSGGACYPKRNTAHAGVDVVDTFHHHAGWRTGGA